MAKWITSSSQATEVDPWSLATSLSSPQLDGATASSRFNTPLTKPTTKHQTFTETCLDRFTKHRTRYTRYTSDEEEKKAQAAFMQLEIVVTNGFDPGRMPGYLACDVGEIVMMIYAQDSHIFAFTHCRAERQIGWLPAEAADLANHYEFFVRLPPDNQPGPSCGLIFADATMVPGLIVIDILPGTSFDIWNRRCLETMPRNQVLPGDFVTWVDGSNDITAMSSILMHDKPNSCRITRAASSIQRRLCADANFSDNPVKNLLEFWRHYTEDSPLLENHNA